MYITECKVTKKIIIIYHFLKKIIQQPHKRAVFFYIFEGKRIKTQRRRDAKILFEHGKRGRNGK
jgi:hypothetical protein